MMYCIVGFDDIFSVDVIDDNGGIVSADSSNTIQIQLSANESFSEESYTGTIEIVPTSPYDMTDAPIQRELTITVPLAPLAPLELDISTNLDEYEVYYSRNNSGYPFPEDMELYIYNNNDYDITYTVDIVSDIYCNEYIENLLGTEQIIYAGDEETVKIYDYFVDEYFEAPMGESEEFKIIVHTIEPEEKDFEISVTIWFSNLLD